MHRHAIPIASVLLAVVLAAPAASAQEVDISREGNWRIWYTSPVLRAELDFHWADLHLGDEWLILKLSIAAGRSGVTSVSRKDVQLQAPDGSIIALPTQEEFRGVRGSMQVAFRQENVWGPPASRFRGSLERIVDWFFSPSGTTFHHETIHPSAIQYCSGPLVFQIPGGVQPGEWTLIIGLEEIRAEIPFVLGEQK